MKLAIYSCCRCPHTWQQPPGPTECPNCGFLYCRWTNYEKDFAKKNESTIKEMPSV